MCIQVQLCWCYRLCLTVCSQIFDMMSDSVALMIVDADSYDLCFNDECDKPQIALAQLFVDDQVD